ncbi:hypothetical protein Daura_36485 [Dactylosporangium aurantiacum]|uniref:Uncharacterized protein n=1 Tax=Dactylosporangium aurantiacum TaxID=35754 RepID=A0A9Q9MAR9_9ACTN|nr:hypothetical protein [Dactylosporangium aurantiacum]MDG6103326.1 hypothetical protein [Dactylosporangium aurantiacum]UWZ52148.1 hypothetical protein Daura_36485 [Dactylosporangium aurantiacum]
MADEEDIPRDTPPPGDGPLSDTAAESGTAPQGGVEGRGRRDRKRRRAIRAHAAQAGVAYSVAARQLAGAGVGPGEGLASLGRTVYPVGLPGRWSLAARERRPAAVKLSDARRAARLAGGRAAHLVERFPAGRETTGQDTAARGAAGQDTAARERAGRERTGQGIGGHGTAGRGAGGLYYAGDGLDDLLAMLYLVVAREAPGLVPAALDLAWTAELGEETAVDIECAEVDRAARLVLDDGVAGLWGRVEAAVRAGQDDASPAIRHDADRLTLVCRAFTMPVEGADGEPYVRRAPWRGAGQVLDALLVVAEDGHAPGTRVRLAGSAAAGTIVGAGWGAAGPPVRYEVRFDTGHLARTVRPEELVVLPGQESAAAALQV